MSEFPHEPTVDLDMTLIGETTMKLMEILSEDAAHGRVIAACVIVAVEIGDSTMYRIRFSDQRFHEQDGLLSAGMRLLHQG